MPFVYYLFSDNTISILEKETVTLRNATFRLDAAQDPKAIDIIFEGKATVGIYQLKGDKLAIRLSLDEQRPTTFMYADGDNKKSVLLYFERKK